MRILFLDTETNGLPKNRYASPKTTDAWPLLVQLAWQVWDISIEKVPVKLYDSSFLISPPSDVVWNVESAAIHGISEKMAREHGKHIAHVLSTFTGDAAECDVAVAHNLAFDKHVLWAASWRLGVNPTTWWPKKEICTMLETVDFCKIPAKFPKPHDPYKWPRLAEVWSTLFPTPVPTGLHNARQDVTVMVTCFQALLERRVIVLEETGRSNRFTEFFRTAMATLLL